MKTSRSVAEKSERLKLAEMQDAWQLSTMLELSQKILDKGVIVGHKIVLSENDRKKLLSYSSKIEPILEKIRQIQGHDAEPLECVIHAWREKIQYYSRHSGKKS